MFGYFFLFHPSGNRFQALSDPGSGGGRFGAEETHPGEFELPADHHVSERHARMNEVYRRSYNSASREVGVQVKGKSGSNE